MDTASGLQSDKVATWAGRAATTDTAPVLQLNHKYWIASSIFHNPILYHFHLKTFEFDSKLANTRTQSERMLELNQSTTQLWRIRLADSVHNWRRGFGGRRPMASLNTSLRYPAPMTDIGEPFLASDHGGKGELYACCH